MIYEAISLESVSTTDGESYLVGKGTVFLPIGKGIIIKAYNAPYYSDKIVAIHLLSKTLNLLFTSELSDNDKIKSDRCKILKKGSRSIVIQVFPCVDSL